MKKQNSSRLMNAWSFIMLKKMHIICGIWALIFFLGYNDFQVIRELFLKEEFGLSEKEARSSAFIFALMLELFPTLTSLSLSKLADKFSRRFNRSSLVFSIMISSGITLVSFALSFYLRWQYIALMMDSGVYKGMVVDQYRLVSPMLTSVMAFLLSQHLPQQTFIQKSQEEFRRKQNAICTLQNRLEEKRNELTMKKNMLAAELNFSGNIPDSLRDYEALAVSKIREHTAGAVCSAVPQELLAYNNSVLTALSAVKNSLAAYSTTPAAIQGIDLDKVIEDYDSVRSTEEKFGYADVAEHLKTQVYQRITGNFDLSGVDIPKKKPAPVSGKSVFGTNTDGDASSEQADRDHADVSGEKKGGEDSSRERKDGSAFTVTGDRQSYTNVPANFYSPAC